MKTKISPLLVGLLLALPFTPLRAALNPAIVPANSKWLGYADFNEMRDSVVGQRLLTNLKAKNLFDEDSPLQPDLPKILETIGNVTAFGDKLSGNHEEMDGALVIEGTPKLRTIVDGLIAHFLINEPDKIEELKGLPFEAYRVHQEVVIALPKEPIILVSRSPERLVATLATYRGKGASLATNPGAMTGMLPTTPDYYLFGASLVPSIETGEANSPQARVLRMTKSAAVWLGESGDNVVANAMLDADSSETATRLGKIVSGMAALFSLAQSKEVDLVAFIDSVKVTQADSHVAVAMAYPAANLVALVEAQWARKSEAVDAAKRDEEDDFEVMGNVIADWRANVGGGAADAGGWLVQEHVTEAVELASGMMVEITARARGQVAARVDYVEIEPVAGGTSERFEAEFMRLSNYRIERWDSASGGEQIRAGGKGLARARFVFHGASGSYRVKVGYLDEAKSAAHFKLSVITPTPAAE